MQTGNGLQYAFWQYGFYLDILWSQKAMYFSYYNNVKSSDCEVIENILAGVNENENEWHLF